MSKGFIQLSRSEKVEWLILNHPNAFLLLTIIALRARRISGSPDGFEIGECHIGDYKSCGIETEKKYRTAKERLISLRAIKIVETCRNRATGRATYGTKVKLLNSEIYEINAEHEGDRKGDRRATEGRPEGDEQECNKIKNEKIIDLIDGEENLAELFVARCKGNPSVISIPKENLKELFKSEGFSLPEITSAFEKFKGKNPLISNNSKDTFINYLRSILENQRADTCKKKLPKKNLKTSSTADKEKCLVKGTSEPILERLMRQNGLN